MEIAVYPGSFNPLHIGHLSIIKTLNNERDYDRIYLIVSPKNPLKDIDSNSAKNRFEKAKKSMDKYQDLKVYVDDIELHMEAPQYTVKTLKALKTREPENNFTLVMGADNLSLIRKWREYKTILSEFGVVVYPRDDFDLVQIKEDLLLESKKLMQSGEIKNGYKIKIIDAPLVNISSTEIRNALSKGEDMKNFLV